MVAPEALRKLTLPVQDAAVPVEELAATLVTFTRAVSVEAKPAGGKFIVRVDVVVDVVCAPASAASPVTVSTAVRICFFIRDLRCPFLLRTARLEGMDAWRRAGGNRTP